MAASLIETQYFDAQFGSNEFDSIDSIESVDILVPHQPDETIQVESETVQDQPVQVEYQVETVEVQAEPVKRKREDLAVDTGRPEGYTTPRETKRRAIESPKPNIDLVAIVTKLRAENESLNRKIVTHEETIKDLRFQATEAVGPYKIQAEKQNKRIQVLEAAIQVVKNKVIEHQEKSQTLKDKLSKFGPTMKAMVNKMRAWRLSQQAYMERTLADRIQEAEQRSIKADQVKDQLFKMMTSVSKLLKPFDKLKKDVTKINSDCVKIHDKSTALSESLTQEADEEEELPKWTQLKELDALLSDRESSLKDIFAYMKTAEPDLEI